MMLIGSPPARVNEFPGGKVWGKKHTERMRAKALHMALDTVVDGGSDRSGNTTASAVLSIAARYLEFIEKGPREKPNRTRK